MQDVQRCNESLSNAGSDGVNFEIEHAVQNALNAALSMFVRYSESLTSENMQEQRKESWSRLLGTYVHALEKCRDESFDTSTISRILINCVESVLSQAAQFISLPDLLETLLDSFKSTDLKESVDLILSLLKSAHFEAQLNYNATSVLSTETIQLLHNAQKYLSKYSSD